MAWAKTLLIVLLAHVAVAAYFVCDRAPGTAAALWGLPLDDAWIHLVYARSLAALHGFAYNPGQLETGSTSPLWAVLLVPASLAARLFGMGVVVPAKITGVLCAVFTSVGAIRLLRGLRLGFATGLVAGLLLVVDPALAFAQVSGMEVHLAAGLALWLLADVAEERVERAALWAALAPLARPELALLSFAFLAWQAWRLRVRRAPGRAWLPLFGPAVILLGAWSGYCWLVTGYPLPSTFYAKFSSRQDYLAHDLELVFGQILPAWPWFARGAGFALWALGAVLLFRRGLVGRALVLFPWLFFVAVASSQLLKEPWPFFWQRYLLPAFPFLLLPIAVGFVHAVDWAWRRRRIRLGPAYVAGVAAALLVTLSALPASLRARAELYAWNCQNIEEMNVAMARWVRDNTPPGEPIAVTDAGAARYFGEHPIFDIVGLNNHRFLHGGRTQASMLASIRTVVSFPSAVPFLRDHPSWRSVHREATTRLTICACPQSELVAYRRVADK